MDKAEYVRLAPVYYALAIAAVLANGRKPYTEWQIRSVYPETDEQTGEEGTLIGRHLILGKSGRLAQCSFDD